MGTSKIAVDLRARTFEIEVPDERVDDILSRLEGLFKLPNPTGEVTSSDSSPHQSAGDENSSPAEETDGESDGTQPAKRRRGNGKGVAKVRSYQLVELNLTSDQRSQIREFFSQKAPAGQNEQVAVLAVKLKEFLQKNNFSAGEIHSAFKIVDLPTPKNMMAVFGNMKRDGRGNYSDNKFIVNSHTEDYVNYHMQKKTNKVKK